MNDDIPLRSYAEANERLASQAETIARLRRDVDVLTGLVIGLVSAAEMRARVAVRNYNGAQEEGGPVYSAICVTELSMQQAQLLRLQNQDSSDLTGEVAAGYQGLIDRLADAIGPYAMPELTDTLAA